MTYSTIQYQDIIIWYDCADVIVQVKSRAGYILCIYTIYLFTTLLCIYLFYIQYFEIVPLTPDFMSDPRFVSFYLSMLTTLGCSPRAVWSQVLRWCIAGAGFGARSRLVDVYIYQLYILITWQACIFSMRCLLRYYSVPIMYWLYITCFRSCISYCISFIYSVHVYPDYYILSLRCEIVVVSFCEIV